VRELAPRVPGVKEGLQTRTPRRTRAMWAKYLGKDGIDRKTVPQEGNNLCKKGDSKGGNRVSPLYFSRKSQPDKGLKKKKKKLSMKRRRGCGDVEPTGGVSLYSGTRVDFASCGSEVPLDAERPKSQGETLPMVIVKREGEPSYSKAFPRKLSNLLRNYTAPGKMYPSIANQHLPIRVEGGAGLRGSLKLVRRERESVTDVSGGGERSLLL